MPEIEIRGVRLHYEERGTGTETVVFAHGLLWSSEMFEHQINALQQRYRCIAFDFRGHGRSSVPRDGYDIDTLTGDAVALIKTLECAPCHWVGHSLGGFVGLRLAVQRALLLRSLTLLNSSASRQRLADIVRYRLLGAVGRWQGIELVAEHVMRVAFGRPFLEHPEYAATRDVWRQRLVANDREGISRALAGVLARRSFDDQLGRIAIPALVVAGELDKDVPLADVQRLHRGIAGSTLVVFPHVGHTTPIENPTAVTEALDAFLAHQRPI
jgi:3-oxoadipate enol-lactonase